MANLIRRGSESQRAELATPQTTWEPFRLMRELMNWDPYSGRTGTADRRCGMYEVKLVIVEGDCECGQHVRIRAVAGHLEQRWACPKCGKRYTRLPDPVRANASA